MRPDRRHLHAPSCSGRFDQIFQEVALQNLPVVFCLDRAGLTGPDGPTHHGVLRHPVHAAVPEHGRAWPPATRPTSQPMLQVRPEARRPDRRSATRRRTSRTVERAPPRRSSWARPRCSSGATTACFVAFGTLLSTCVKAAAKKLQGRGHSTSASSTPASSSRSTRDTILRAVEDAAAGRDGRRRHARRRLRLARCWRRRTRPGWTRGTSSACGMPDRFVEHGERDELLADLGLSVDALVELVRTNRAAEVAKCG